jgi:hypothetical protein
MDDPQDGHEEIEEIQLECLLIRFWWSDSQSWGKGGIDWREGRPSTFEWAGEFEL